MLLFVVIVYDNDKSSSRSRKLAKQRAVPVGTTGAVQFSEKCLRQEGGGVKVDGEIIFQAPIAPTDGSTATDVSASESKEGDQLAEELVVCESPLNEETSSLLNVAAPEFVPESTPTEIKDEEENIAVNNSSDVSSSQGGQSHKHRHFNKHQAYPYHMIPDYMVRGPPFPPLHLPYAPYLIPRHPREPLIPLSMPFGYPYPPMHLQQSRMFPDGFPTRHPQIYAAGIPSEIYMMDFMGGPFPQDAQNRHYPWGSIPEQAGQSPEPTYEAHDGSQDDGVGSQEMTSSNTNVTDTTESRSHDSVTLSEDGGNQYPVADSTSQLAAIVEHNDPQLLDDTSGNNISNMAEVFSEEVHPIKDNSTGQVVDNGYIHKDIDSSHKDKTPSVGSTKASLELDSSSKSDLESSSEKAEVTELSQDTPPADNTVQHEDGYCTATTIADVSVPAIQPSEEMAKQPPEHMDRQQPLEDAQPMQTEHVVVPESVKPELQPTITPSSADSDNKVVPEEKSAVVGLPVAAKKLPSTALGNNPSEQKIKAPPVTGEPQQHKVDKKTSYNNSRTSNQISSSRENNYSRIDSQTSASSGKISSKGSNKSGPSIILRAANPPEKKAYQQIPHIDSVHVNTSSSRDMSHSSSSGSSFTSQAELKKTQLNTSAQSVSKETNNSSMVSNNNSSNVQNNSQVEVKKSQTVQAWGQAKKWSQLFNNGTSSKDTALPTKDPVVQSNSVPATSPGEPVAKQASTPPNAEHINKQLKSLGGKGTYRHCV